MAVKIELKRSAVPGRVPTTSSLELGELAINTYDGKLFYKQDVSGSESIIQVATTSGSILSASYANNAGNANTATSSSYALNSTSASYTLFATSASHALNANNAISASYALNTTSASYALNSTSASYAQTSSFATDFTVAGTLTAQKLVVQTISSSIIYSSGSNIFGDELSDTQTFTGSVSITGSLSINGKDFTNTSASFDTRILNNSSSISLLSGSYLASSASFDTRIINNSSSISILSGSYLNSSASFDTRISNNSSSISTLSGSYLNSSASFDTRILNNSSSIVLLSGSYLASSASFDTRILNNSSSIGLLSGSYLNSSSSFDIRILNNSSSIDLLSGSYLLSSASFDTRILNNSSSIGTLSGSYLNSSASFDTRILNNSSSIDALSSSFTTFSSSYNTGSFTGSFKGDGSGLYNISASGIVGLNLSQIASGSVTASIDPNLGFRVNTNTTISGSTLISGSLTVTGSTNLYGTTGTLLSANVDTLVFTGSIYSSGSTILTGNLDVTDSITALNLSTGTNGVALGFGTEVTVLNLGGGTGTSLNRFAYGATTSGVRKNIEIGTNGLSGSYTSTLIGSIISDGLVTFNNNTLFNEKVTINANLSKTSPTGDTVVLDTFTEASNTLLNLHTPDTGSGWTRVQIGSFTSPTFTVFGDTDTMGVTTNIADQGVIYIENTTLSNPNYEVRVDLIVQDSLDDTMWLFTRYQDSDNWYGVRWSTSGGLIIKKINGVFTTLAALSAVPQTGVSSLALRIYDNNILVLNGDTAVMGATDTSITDAGFAGIGAGNIGLLAADNFENWRFDNFTVQYYENDNSLIVLDVTGSLLVSGSTNVVGNTIITGSLTVTNGITGSLHGTASWAENAITASYVLNAISASYADNTTSASYAQTSSYANTFIVDGDITGSNALFTGTVTAQKLNVQTISSSVIYSSGSNIFGNSLSNTQIFTGSVGITGSLSVNNSLVILSNQTSSMSVLSASYANNATSASYALTASYAMNGGGGVLSIANEGITQGTASYFDFIGEGVTATVLNNTASITIEKVVTGSTSFLDQTTPSTTWSFDHNLNSKYINFEIYDSSDFVIIPAGIRVLNTNNAEIYFSIPTTGKAVAQFSGIDGAVNALTASYALTAVSASYAATASFVGYNHVQTSSSNIWNIPHNLNNQYPMVQVYNSDSTVISPMSISGSDVNTTVITFSFNTTGYVRII
jgi:hypothetical protein